MAISSRMKWPYPSEGADPWYDAFESLVSAQDASTFAVEEAKNIIMSGGGTLTWSVLTGVLTWTEPLVLNSSNSGFLESIPAGTISVPDDGDLGYVRFLSSPQENVTLVLRVAATVPNTDPDRTFVIFRRKGSRLFFRNGAVLQDGESAAIIDDGPGAGAGTVEFQRDGVVFGTTDTLNFVGPVAIAGTVAAGVASIELQLASASTQVTVTPYTLDTDYRAFYVNRATPSVVNLPSASTLAEQFVLIKTVTGNPVTVQATGPDTVDGGASVSISGSYDGMLLHSASLDGGATWDWYITSRTLAGGGTVTSVTASAPLASSGGGTPNISLTGIVPVVNGGTGLAGYAVGDIIYASGVATLAKLADVATGNVLLSGGVGVAPSYGKVGLATHVSGVLPETNGGTGNSSYTTGDLLYATSPSTLGKLPDVATGNVLLSGGVGAGPSYGKVALTSHVSGTLPISNGGTGTTTVPSNGQILIGDGTGYQVANIATGSGISITDSPGGITITNSGVISINASGGTTGMTFSGGPVSHIGTLTLGGTLGVANGGTGLSLTPAAGQLLIGDGSGFTAATLTAGSNISISNGPGAITISATFGGGTVTSVTASSPLASSGGTTPNISLTGIVPIANGGTGVNTVPTNGKLLIGNGTGYSSANLTAGSNIAITNGAGTVTVAATGVVTSVSASAPLASSGGTSPTITHSTSGVAAGTYSNATVSVDLTGHVTSASSGPAPVTSVAASAPLTSTGGTTPTIGIGTVPVTKGGTGITTVPGNGKLLIGNGVDYTSANLTAGAGISITNGAGNVTISAIASSSFTFTMTAAESIAVGDMVASNPSGQAVLADCTLANHYPALGVCTNVTLGVVTVQPLGPSGLFSGLTPGQTYFIGTAGGLVTTPPIGAVIAQPAVQAYSSNAGVVLTANTPVYL